MTPPSSPIPQRRQRPNGLPEYHQYTDDGCPWHPHCLTCPFHRCRYDAPHQRQRRAYLIRRALVRRFHRLGLTPAQIILHTGIPRRTVYRILTTLPPLDKPAHSH